MKTSTAMAAHNVIGLAQAGAVAAGMGQSGLPWWAELLIQVGLAFGQGLVAKRNSETDPQGKPL